MAVFTEKKFHYLLLFFAVFMVYFNALGNDFVWDDISLVVENSLIKSFKNIGSFFSSDLHAVGDNSANFYRPMQLVSFALDYFLYGLNPKGFHFTNILIHFFNVMLFYYLCLCLNAKKIIALASAFFFGIHPVQTETVSYISGRADLLAIFFIMLSFIFYIYYEKNNKTINYLFSIIAFVFSLMSKEVAIVFPLMLLTYILFFVELKNKKVFSRILAYFLISIVYVILRKTFLDFSNTDNLSDIDFSIRFLNSFKIIYSYLKIFFMPVSLHMERKFILADSFFNVSVLLGFVTCFLLIVFSRKLYYFNKTACFGLAWFFIFLIPVLNLFVQINAFLSEHWLYFSAAGLLLFIVSLIFDLAKKIQSRSFSIIVSVVFSLVAVSFVCLTIKANTVWSNNETLYLNILKKGNPSFRIYNNLGNYYAKNKKYKNAVQCYAEAIRLNPMSVDAYNNMGIAYKKQGKFDKALKCYEKVISMAPDYGAVYSNVAVIYEQKGQYDKAMKSYDTAIKMMPGNSRLYTNLSNLYMTTGMYNLAIEACKKAIELDRLNINAYNNLGVIYTKTKAYGDAVFYFEKGLSLSPKSKILRQNLNVLLETVRYQEEQKSV